jgi:hypothetical protein
MRTYSFDDSKAHSPEAHDTRAGGARYGRQHARTAELYHQRRLQRQRAEQMAVNAVQPEPVSAEAPAVELKAPEQELKAPETVEQSAEAPPETSEHETLRDRAQHAVTSVLQAAREVHPVAGAKKLARGAVSGALRVVRQVSAHTAKGKKR